MLSAIVWHGVLVFFRVSAFASLLPAFGEQTVPLRIRLAVAVVFSMLVAPAVAPHSPPENLTETAWLVLSEVAAGLVLGIGLRLFVVALQTAGSMAAQATSLSQIFGGLGGEPVPAIGNLLVVGGLALAVTSGLHVKAAAFLIASYEMIPPGSAQDAGPVSRWGVARISGTFALAFTLAAPFVIASAVYNLALGVINRAMPQLMVAFVGAPVITFGGLFLLMACAPLILSVWADAMDAFLLDPGRQSR